ncbi:MAG: 2-phosphosulfolactate phosphatase [Bacteroidetes bacterium SW_9_63_38]|nr:MAG: 2-phosphosulfolactate phosphatase [Bacteroidetes bacterium SW_9_63_38]
MDAEVFLTYANVSEEDVRNRTVVVIDVLRACSTIATALERGARAVMPVADMAEAGKIAANLGPDVYRLGGERDGDKIDGYHLGNSPAEYAAETVQGRDIILNTTNGTRALTQATSAEHLVVGCFLNASRVVDFVRAAADEVTLICAGHNNRLSLEDTLCAGLLLDRLWDDRLPDVVTDSAHTAFTLYDTDRTSLETSLRRANHAEELVALGYADDLDYCFRVDALSVLPYHTDNRLLRYDEQSTA